MKMEEEILAAKRNAERFGQLFQLISEGFAEYIKFGENFLQEMNLPKSNGQEDGNGNNEDDDENDEDGGAKRGKSLSAGAKTDVKEEDEEEEEAGNQQNQDQEESSRRRKMRRRIQNQYEDHHVRLLLENHRLYKVHAQRLAKLQIEYADLRMQMDQETHRLFTSSRAASSSSSFPSSFSRFVPPILFCRRPSPQRRRRDNNRLCRQNSHLSLQLNPPEEETNNHLKEDAAGHQRRKSQSILELNSEKRRREEEEELQNRKTTTTKLRTIKAAMGAIEAELCGMMGRLQFEVQGIVGFARLCTGDVFEVSIKHGTQRWRTRGKTQPDKTQHWDTQPPMTLLNVLWNVPIVVKVNEVGFIRSRCLNERQFDPAKFASAQPQLVTMNLNSVGSIKLRLLVSWLPLLSSKMPPPPSAQGHPNQAIIASQQQPQSAEHYANGKSNYHLQQQHSLSELPPKVPSASSKVAMRQPSMNGGTTAATSSSNSQSAILANNQPQQPGVGKDSCSPVKVCLRDKKRQREQRIQMGMSVATSLGNGIGIGREASRTDKDRWRCSSTTLLDELYKDLSKSIPTIDDLSALHPKSGSFGGGSLGPAAVHRSFTITSELDGTGNNVNGPHPQPPLPCSSSSVSEGRVKNGATKRIFSFLKRNEKGNGSGSSGREKEKEDWRKSISLGQISIKNERDGMEEPDEFPDDHYVPERKGSGGVATNNGIKNGGGTAEGRTIAIEANESTSRRSKLSNLKKSRSALQQNGKNNPFPSAAAANTTPMDDAHGDNHHRSSPTKYHGLEHALRNVDSLLAKIEHLRALLAKLRSAEYPELVGFEASMLNWEACLKLNRSGILCQMDGHANAAAPNSNRSNGPMSNGHQLAGSRSRNGGPAGGGSNGLRHRLMAANGQQQQRNSVLFPSSYQQQQYSPSTTSEEMGDEHYGGCQNGGGGGSGGMSSMAFRAGNGEHQLVDQISENDSGIDSLRQYHSPYNSAASASSGSSKRFSAEGRGGGGGGKAANLMDGKAKDRRKSIGTMLDVMQQQSAATAITIKPTEIDECLAVHLDRAELALQAIFEVQQSPFEYTLSRMLSRMEGIETIALESMLGIVQDLRAQCETNPQNVLLQLGLQFHLQQCWLSACEKMAWAKGNSECFLLLPLDQLRAEMRHLCEPIVKSRYPKLVEKVLDSLCSLLLDAEDQPNQQQQPLAKHFSSSSPNQLISVFQFVALFRAKQFTAFIENLSHEAWITVNLQSGQANSLREVMERLRNVPVVPPMESLRHIGLALAQQEQQNVIAPIEKYLRKASPDLAFDLAACFLCLLEHNEEASRLGACRALAILGKENALVCLEFLSRSDSSSRVRAEAKNAAAQIRKAAGRAMQKEMTKI